MRIGKLEIEVTWDKKPTNNIFLNINIHPEHVLKDQAELDSKIKEGYQIQGSYQLEHIIIMHLAK